MWRKKMKVILAQMKIVEDIMEQPDFAESIK